MCVGLVAAGYRLHHPVPVAVLALLAIAAEHEGIRLTPAVEVSVASLLCIFAVVAFGPLSAVVVGAAGLLADLPRRDDAQPVLRWLTWTAIRVVVVGGAGLTAGVCSPAAAPGVLGVFFGGGAAFLVGKPPGF